MRTVCLRGYRQGNELQIAVLDSENLVFQMVIIGENLTVRNNHVGFLNPTSSSPTSALSRTSSNHAREIVSISVQIQALVCTGFRV